MMNARNILSVGLFWVLMLATAGNGQQDKAAGAVEWDKLVDAAKKEAKVTVSLPASAEMKKQVEEQFKKRYGIEPWLALPEVKDPKQWWGGHLWIDNAKRFIYTFQAYLSEVVWYNTDLI